jgi:trk system potassium uptake protein TrkH
VSIDEHIRPLVVAVRAAVVLKYLGQLLLIVALTALAPFLFALVTGEPAAGLRYLLVALLLAPAAVLLARRRAPERLQDNEALVITALVFLLAPLAMVYPVMGQGIRFEDALFETVSAITTTGLSTLVDMEGRPQTLLFARAWMQWYGGLGIVVLSLALLVGPGVAARRLAQAGMEWEGLISGTRLHARRVLNVYLALTLLGILGLWLTGLDWYRAVLHALAGVSTGGFSTYDASMAGFGTWSARAVLMLLSLAGAVSLALYHPAYFPGWKGFRTHAEVRGLVVAALMTSLLLAFCMLVVGARPWGDVIRNAPLVAISAQAGAGFTSLDVGGLDPGSKLALIVSMLIGGGVGSTAGGIKILRLLILLRLLQLLVQRACLPRSAVVRPRVSGHTLEGREIEHSLLIILLFGVIVLLSWFPFVALGYPPLDALFDVVSAVATVGLSTGVTGPELPSLLKGLLCIDMLIGRLEGVALLLVLYPRTWIGRGTE